MLRGDVDNRELDAAVGKWGRVEGTVSRTKQPQIAGIDVDSFRELFDKRAWAEGTLKRRVERAGFVGENPPQMRSGTFYRLVDPATGDTAMAHALLRRR